MPVIIKEMRVLTIVEKKMDEHENSEEILYNRLKADICEMLALEQESGMVSSIKRER